MQLLWSTHLQSCFYWILYYMRGIVINHHRLWTLQWWHGILNQEGKKSGCCCLYCFSYFPFAMCHVSVSYHNDNVTDHVVVACRTLVRPRGFLYIRSVHLNLVVHNLNTKEYLFSAIRDKNIQNLNRNVIFIKY
jgi:hypothetical protein